MYRLWGQVFRLGFSSSAPPQLYVDSACILESSMFACFLFRNFFQKCGSCFPVEFQDVGSKFSCRRSGRNILNKKLFYLLFGGRYR